MIFFWISSMPMPAMAAQATASNNSMMIGLCPRMINTTTTRNATSSAIPVPRSMVFPSTFCRLFLIAAFFCEISLAQQTGAVEEKKRPGTRQQHTALTCKLFRVRVLPAAASQYARSQSEAAGGNFKLRIPACALYSSRRSDLDEENED